MGYKEVWLFGEGALSLKWEALVSYGVYNGILLRHVNAGNGEEEDEEEDEEEVNKDAGAGWRYWLPGAKGQVAVSASGYMLS